MAKRKSGQKKAAPKTIKAGAGKGRKLTKKSVKKRLKKGNGTDDTGPRKS